MMMMMMMKPAVLLLVCSALYGVVWTTTPHSLNVNLDKVLFTVNRQFLSVCIDASDLTHPQWTPAAFPARAINMAKALSPAMLRVGGTSGDHLVFNKRLNTSLKDIFPNSADAQISPEQWDALNEFTINVGWDFVFGLNILVRKGVTSSSVGTWDPSNAKQLIEYTESKGYKVNWELGNEPKGWPINVTAQELAHDFATLADLLKVTNYSVWIVGPDIIPRPAFLFEFLEQIESEGSFLHAVTWHEYTLSNKAKQEEYTELSTFDHCLKNLFGIGKFINLSGYHGELWLGETADAYDGGVYGASNTYLGGFLWMDKLGATARSNYSRVFRQTFVGGFYGLLNADYQPVPTYWISVLHKKLVGTRVLSVLDHMTYVRMYSHCGLSAPGSIVMLVVSISQSDTEVTIKNPQLQQSLRDVYWLTPSVPGHLDSSGVALGGKELVLDGDNLPQFNPTHQQPSNTMMIPSLSYGFIVFKDAAATACKYYGVTTQSCSGAWVWLYNYTCYHQLEKTDYLDTGYEDNYFIKDGGDLLLCDFDECLKVYHPTCLCMSEVPDDTFICPQHVCNDCPSPAVQCCTNCSSSYCSAHFIGRLQDCLCANCPTNDS